ncbi:TniQ family protein [Lentzea sp. BCCO 10_0061]|uniref:TniQ family protein n=1 Tax=Lentzea sokolovensis TaxID=3095429 RepID=A0ABU4UWA4_9PSEU|nr:LysR family transcriptional regulator [Lentzea sp. BCCO 10_0061]MDX8143284.1 TniQ family protein [Lentzea sp. BCCO 10_0061]
MITRIPFTLAPLPGEPFGLWWHTYALRLGVTRAELAHAAGIPSGMPPGPEHAVAIAAAAGLTADEVNGMFATCRPCPPEHVLRVWAPQLSSRFCPGCLADGTPWQDAWALPLRFYCPAHDQPLAERCPACGTTPPSRRTPAGIALTSSSCPFCDHDLTATGRHHASHDGEPSAAAQKLITTTLSRMRDPAATARERERAQEQLTDVTLIALHFTQDDVATQRGFNHRLPDATAFTTAVGILTAPSAGSGQDPLARLVTRCSRGPRSRAVPFSWRTASPALITRIARARDTSLTPIERIRYATTLPADTARPRGRTDPALTRARRLPDQLWPVWTIRLVDDDGLDGSAFRAALIVALLLPHSNLQLKELTPLLPHQPEPAHVTHQLRRLTAITRGDAALRILTELGLALDQHDIPIDYARRRHLVADIDLIDKPTWTRYCRDAGLRSGGQRRLGLARRYLYELLTAGNLAAAPEPYRLPEGAPRADFVEFCASLPVHLVAALTAHAEETLTAAGISDEPLTWHPPVNWTTVTEWPGADPEHTDPGPIHEAVLTQWSSAPHNHWAPTHIIADTLGISSHHLRYVLRQHPIDHAPYRQHRSGAIIPMPRGGCTIGYRADPHPDDPTRIFLVDPDWLREQYTTWNRSLTDIANEIGCRKATLRAFAEAQGIPRRPRSGGTDCITTGTIAGHPADMPYLLRKSLIGRQSRHRLERFLAMTHYPSLNQAASALGVHQCTLTSQLQLLERACGGLLFHRLPHPQPIGPLTPLGEQLCQQAREHLDHALNT